MLIGNKIEFVESTLKTTTQVIPSEINLNKRSNTDYFLSIYCEEDKNIRVLDLSKDVPNIIKIWGEETKIEKIIRIVKETEKYNL